MISQKKWEKLRRWMTKLDISEDDIEEKFVLGQGRGGQKVQKTASCVYLKHMPLKIEIKCQLSRMREDNRYLARKRLCEKVDEKLNQALSEKQKKIEKIKRQKRKRSKRSKEKVLALKHHQGKKKKARKPPGFDD
jgi:peptide chain release factor